VKGRGGEGREGLPPIGESGSASDYSSCVFVYTVYVCQKSDTLLVSEFSTLVRCMILAINNQHPHS